MNPDSSPFTPRQLVGADSFTGRAQYIDELLVAVRRAKRGVLSVGWIGGERGIGKSSLASYAGLVAERKESALFAHVHLGETGTVKDMAQKAYLSLLADNRDKSWGGKLFNLFGDRVRAVGLYGLKIELKMKPDELPSSLDGLALELAGIIEKSPGRKALALALDDINGLAEEPRFAHSIKGMVDSLAGRKKIPVCMFLVGLEERLDAMRKNNPSVVRCFSPFIRVEPWTLEENADFFRAAFNSGGACVESRHIDFLALHCGGMPTIAHEIGDAVWRLAENEKITAAEMTKGIAMAARSIGDHFLRREVVNALQSKTYRSILGKIAHEFPSEFSKKQLLAPGFLAAAEQKGLDNFLRRMRKLGGFLPVEGEPGAYRFPSQIHRIYYELDASALKTREG